MEIKSEQSLGYTLHASVQEKKNKEVQDRTPPGTQVAEQAHANKADKVQEPLEVTAKKQLNQSILQASLDVNLSVGNEPMALLFKTALEGINKALEDQLGPNAIQNSYAQGLDVSPQATADRIVQMSTAFFDKYQSNHPELGIDEALSSFTKLIGGGIDTGFKEARDILSGLNVLNEGNIASNIDATYELVQKGLQAFVENYQKPEVAAPAPDAAA